jgi:MMPL family
MTKRLRSVTSAAIIMVAVFAIFATLQSLDMKQMGVGLAVAVLIDATLIRAVLLPATMKLLGDWNCTRAVSTPYNSHRLHRSLDLGPARRARAGTALRSRTRRCRPAPRPPRRPHPRIRPRPMTWFAHPTRERVDAVA